jgi:hypothetical protein
MTEQGPPVVDVVAQAQARGVLGGSKSSNSNPDALSAVPSASPPAAPIDFSSKREFLWKVQGYTHDYIRFGDTKSGFCVGIASALMGALFATKSHELFLQQLPSQYAGHRSVLATLSLLAFITLGISIVAAVMVIRPRLWIDSKKGFIFWGSISKFESATAFATQFAAQTDEELEDTLLHHLFTVARICRRKYIWINVSMVALVVGGTLSVIVLLLKA